MHAGGCWHGAPWGLNAQHALAKLLLLQVLEPLDQPLMISPAAARDLSFPSFFSIIALLVQGINMRSPEGPLGRGKSKECLLAEIADVGLQVPPCWC